eukprot:CAMPEP_0172068796 /NCGR_PEP_ID=MMETSP1043-20130122/12401_1 /TAXON_ID=464988 /ORGANISM="Hemiselmis andersenii, Strain CCMP441" /LENGTH=149 /DNA_ID=CAMNT_0012729077 /DNA_START=30 /DNA_END=476 /DNA_ORIENTATION=+
MTASLRKDKESLAQLLQKGGASWGEEEKADVCIKIGTEHPQRREEVAKALTPKQRARLLIAITDHMAWLKKRTYPELLPYFVRRGMVREEIELLEDFIEESDLFLRFLKHLDTRHIEHHASPPHQHHASPPHHGHPPDHRAGSPARASP